MPKINFHQNGQWSLNKSADVIPSYTFKDAKHVPSSGKKAGFHEYSVHHDGQHIGYAAVEHDGGVGGSVDWDKHPHLHSQLMAHHTSQKRTVNTNKN